MNAQCFKRPAVEQGSMLHPSEVTSCLPSSSRPARRAWRLFPRIRIKKHNQLSRYFPPFEKKPNFTPQQLGEIWALNASDESHKIQKAKPSKHSSLALKPRRAIMASERSNASIARLMTDVTHEQKLSQEEESRLQQFRYEFGLASGQPTCRRPFYLGPFGSSDEVYEARIMASILKLERASGMHTDAQQREKLAKNFRAMVVQGDANSPIAIGLSAFMTWRRKKRVNLSFPFVGATKNPDPTVFPTRQFLNNNPRFPAVPFPASYFVWHLARFTAYLIVIRYFVMPPIDIGMKTWNAISLSSDPGIATIFKASMEKVNSDVTRRRADAMERFERLKTPGAMQRPQPRAEPEKQDQGKRDGWDYSSSSTSPQDSSPSSWDASPESSYPSQVPPASSQQQRDGASSDHGQPQKPWGTSSFNDSAGSDVFEDDDASPVARPHRGQTSNSQGDQHPATSWEELRRRAQQVGQQQSPRPNPPTQNSGTAGQAGTPGQEQYTYAETDKDKAQKEFDAMLEAERKGADGSWKKW
ncbi:hypothetical protein MKZ38_009594 [Zalerion maritima]|uniref:Uncharacterized protein n=1 Tax=Zalerion maritima TaxID=339359 RepID=A0AAD5WN45_9PEZI|nr:hypothetical protein MKZ38_009594 [Zalerion maritima]